MGCLVKLESGCTGPMATFSMAESICRSRDLQHCQMELRSGRFLMGWREPSCEVPEAISIECVEWIAA